MKNKEELTEIEEHVMFENGTESPFQNKYWNHDEKGIYVDKMNGIPLFSSQDKFHSSCGWPSFSKSISKNVLKHIPDHSNNMLRTEVRSKKSNIHLGHVFEDGPVDQGGLMYCINSESLCFIALKDMQDKGYAQYKNLFEEKNTCEIVEKIYLSGGCFWGMEHLFSLKKGVLSVSTGYSGGKKEKAYYSFVKTGQTEHAECIEVVFDPKRISYEDCLKFFFQIHDSTTLYRQGNDVGYQYRSALFYTNDQQKKTALEMIEFINQLKILPGPIVTQVVPFQSFYKAEEKHQNYLKKHPNGYTCHWIRKQWSC